jgi:hypothetical protein
MHACAHHLDVLVGATPVLLLLALCAVVRVQPLLPHEAQGVIHGGLVLRRASSCPSAPSSSKHVLVLLQELGHLSLVV